MLVKLEQPDKPDALLSVLNDRIQYLKQRILEIEDYIESEDFEVCDYQQGLLDGYNIALNEMISAYNLVLNFRKMGV